MRIDFATIVENVRDAVFVIENGRIVFVSPSVKNAGYNPAEMVGKHVSEFVYGEDVEKIVELLTKLERGEIEEFEVRVRARARDRIIWVEVRGRKIGEQIVFVARDISELVSLNTMLRAAVDASRLLQRFASWEEIVASLRGHFSDAEINFGEGVATTTLSGRALTAPIKVGEEAVGSLTVELPEWFAVHGEAVEVFEAIASDIAVSIVLRRLREAGLTSLDTIREAIRTLEKLVDGVRNALAIIGGVAEMKMDAGTSKTVTEQVNRIVRLMDEIDRVWMRMEEAEAKLRLALAEMERAAEITSGERSLPQAL